MGEGPLRVLSFLFVRVSDVRRSLSSGLDSSGNLIGYQVHVDPRYHLIECQVHESIGYCIELKIALVLGLKYLR